MGATGTTPYLLPATPADTDRWIAPDLTASTRRIERGTYAPTYTATTTTPVLGSTGFIRGAWYRTGLRVNGWIDLSYAGTGVVFGGTAIQTGLPFLADLTLHSAGALAAASHVVGNFELQSSTAAESITGALILSAAGTMLMYRSGSTSSVGGALWVTGTTGRIKMRFRYIASTANFP